MAKIETWEKLPARVRQHLIDRMRDRSISIADLNQLRLWIESEPEVPEGDWYRDFGSFKICGRGSYPKTFLLRGQAGKGQALFCCGCSGERSASKRVSLLPANGQITGAGGGARQ